VQQDFARCDDLSGGDFGILPLQTLRKRLLGRKVAVVAVKGAMSQWQQASVVVNDVRRLPKPLSRPVTWHSSKAL
jgi:hypothetical protein